MIQIIFERGEEPMIYRDALHLPENHGLSDTEIEALKDQRYSDWKAFVEAASDTPSE